MMLNQMFKLATRSVLLSSFLCFSLISNTALAQAPDLQKVRWKSESQVRALLGEPESVRGPIGTHASYKLWKYADFTVAFANERVFHIFDKDSLTRFDIKDKRS